MKIIARILKKGEIEPKLGRKKHKNGAFKI